MIVQDKLRIQKLIMRSLHISHLDELQTLRHNSFDVITLMACSGAFTKTGETCILMFLSILLKT